MNSHPFEQFENRARLCGVELNSTQLAGIKSFCAELSSYNQRVNLVSRSDLDFLLFDHVLDSLSLIPLMNILVYQSSTLVRPPDSLVDIGSGAGFPGLILALLMSDLKVTLIESTAKKYSFLKAASATLQLESRVEVVNARAEVIGHDNKYRNQFQFATARAIGSLELIAELAIPLLEVGGFLMAQKSTAQVESELTHGKEFFPLIGAAFEQTAHLNKEALGKDRAVVVLQKASVTPDLYPRPYGKIAKGVRQKL